MSVVHAECLDILQALDDKSVATIGTDPPYSLGFMGKGWDRVLPDPAIWRECLRVAQPGAHLLAFGGTRTFHRLACQIEDAGWEIRDCLMWLHGQGFPKAKSCLKPAWEPILLARKKGHVEPLQIDACRIGSEVLHNHEARNKPGGSSLQMSEAGMPLDVPGTVAVGRWPANLVLDEHAAALLDAQSGERRGSPASWSRGKSQKFDGILNAGKQYRGEEEMVGYGDTGGASRFFYCGKASPRDRGEFNTHPTVKPLALMRWLVRLVTPPGGLVLDPFAGSGTTALACELEGFPWIAIEREEAYVEIIERRLAALVREAG